MAYLPTKKPKSLDSSLEANTQLHAPVNGEPPSPPTSSMTRKTLSDTKYKQDLQSVDIGRVPPRTEPAETGTNSAKLAATTDNTKFSAKGDAGPSSAAPVTSEKKRRRFWKWFRWPKISQWIPCVGDSSATPVNPHESDVRATNPTKTTTNPTNNPSTAPIAFNTPSKQDMKPSEDNTKHTKQLPLPVIQSPQSKDVVLPQTPTRNVLSADETAGMTSGAVQPPGSTLDTVTANASQNRLDSGSESDSYSEEDDLDDQMQMEDALEEERRLIMNGGAGIPIGPDGKPRPLLSDMALHHKGRPCLVLDLDETLVHSSFKSIQQADFIVPVEIENTSHSVYVIKRPGVDEFMRRMGQTFEVVVFTASLSKYADPVLDKLDIHQVVSHRLFRESCYNHKGNYVKDLSQLGRYLPTTIILDNSPASYIFHVNNAVPVSSWFNDPHDTELMDLCPFLEDLAAMGDVTLVLNSTHS